MTTALERAAWPGCRSALALDRWLSGELAPAEAAELDAHVAACARCAPAAAELRAGREAPLPPLALAGRTPGTAAPARRAPRALWLGLGAGGLAAAAAVLLLARAPEGDRTKGGVGLGMWVQHDGQVRRAGPGEVVAPGDAIRFAVTTPAPSYVAVLSLDPAGRASVYFPAGPLAERVMAGADLPLPLATRLDATVGEERVLGLFCDRPVELEPVRAALEAGRDDAVPHGCQVTGWSFGKR
jgi:hypothetical protein